jgi:hypothetical protein
MWFNISRIPCCACRSFGSNIWVGSACWETVCACLSSNLFALQSRIQLSSVLKPICTCTEKFLYFCRVSGGTKGQSSCHLGLPTGWFVWHVGFGADVMIKQFAGIIPAFVFVGWMKHFWKAKVLAVQNSSVFQLAYINHNFCLFIAGPTASAALVPLRGCTWWSCAHTMIISWSYIFPHYFT